MSQQRYDLAEYDSEEERRQDPQGPPLENQVAAAQYIGSKIQSEQGVYALMGGFALLLLGSRRATRDVDMVTDLQMRKVWALVEGDPRLVIPTKKNVAKTVEVDIALPGVKGTPKNIRGATATIRNMSSLDVVHVLRGKLYHYADRQFDRDFEDILFLLRSYERDIVTGRKNLRESDVEAFLDSEDLSKGDRARFTQILLG
ncbi:unnamed protein product [Zymoseptoria tritici ST99CH_1A5]|uniref:Uncharacterized protein n=1 Tax=Zymoseptoria tritici ST99CH_1A5 TaxID=1276529 RepID=A0A1Y6LB16_ZYMTR|nr:unnamed protein product [Zymoseptoria tritici ST99CH_1A5]